MSERKAFDPGDAFDAMADSFRVQVAQIALDANKAAVFRELPPDKQLGCLICGIMTGLLGVGYAFVHPDGHAALRDSIRGYVDDAGHNAEDILQIRSKPRVSS